MCLQLEHSVLQPKGQGLTFSKCLCCPLTRIGVFPRRIKEEGWLVESSLVQCTAEVSTLLELSHLLSHYNHNLPFIRILNVRVGRYCLKSYQTLHVAQPMQSQKSTFHFFKIQKWAKWCWSLSHILLLVNFQLMAQAYYMRSFEEGISDMAYKYRY